MGTDDHINDEHVSLSCEVCMKEIPKTVSQSYEGPDYVFYFCGSNCFDKWEHQRNTKVPEEKK